MDNLIVDDREFQGSGRPFNLADAMLSQKKFNVLQEDVKKFKMILTDMQIFVQEHQVAIKQHMVTEEKLRITAELLEAQTEEAIRRGSEGTINLLKPKIKKRIKFKTIENKFREKVGLQEFKQESQRLDNKIMLIQDRVDYKLPAIEFELSKALLNKADKDATEKMLGNKIDKEAFDTLVERLNKIEETLN